MTTTTLITIICKCGNEMTYRRQLIWDNKDGSIRCHVCAEVFSASDILARENNGIAHYSKGEENGI